MRTLLTLAMIILMTAAMSWAAPQKKTVSTAPVAVPNVVSAPAIGQVMLSGKPVLSIKTG